jgi:hypothetical protein
MAPVEKLPGVPHDIGARLDLDGGGTFVTHVRVTGLAGQQGSG